METHVQLLQPLKRALKLSASDEAKYTIVTDGEIPLIQAWRTVFPHINLLLCYNHCHQNIKDQLSYRMPQSVTKEARDEVMTTICGSGAYRGLMDLDQNEINDALPKLYRAWYAYYLYYLIIVREKILGEQNGEAFTKYMKRNKIPLLKSSIARDTRENSGIVHGKRVFTNISESWNRQVKAELKCNRRTSFFSIVEGMTEHLIIQSYEVHKAYLKHDGVRVVTKDVSNETCSHMISTVC